MDPDAVLGAPHEGHLVYERVELLGRQVVVVELAWFLEDYALRVKRELLALELFFDRTAERLAGGAQGLGLGSH